MANMREMVEADKEIKEYLDTTNKSEKGKREILEDCWKNDSIRAKWLAEARRNKPKPKDDKPQDKGKASASQHHDGQQQSMAGDIKKRLIIRAQAEAHDAIKHGNIDPLVAVNDALSNAVDRAVDDARAAARVEVRKS
jgi:hypothetical protein